MADWVLETTENDVAAALHALCNASEEPRIVEAAYHPEPSLDLFVLHISDGRRLVLPRENLQALAGSTPEQAARFVVGPHGTDIWWPSLDQGHYLPNLLEGRSGTEQWMAALKRQPIAA